PVPATAPTAGRSSGWPVMEPPDLPARPVQRAPLTDVVPKRTLVIIAVVVVLAVIGTVLAVTLNGDGSDSSRGEDGGRPVASQGTSAGTKEDESGGARTDGAVGQSAEPGGTSPSGGAGTQVSPATGGAVSTYKGGQGYSIGLPAGWAFKTASSAGDRFTGPGGQKLLVAWTDTPQDDPVADWKRQERSMRRAQYEKVRIEAVSYRGWNTADWEFTYTESGTSYRTIDRGFVVGGTQGYALMYTAKADDWAGELRKSTWTALTESFRPKK
ncbi:serine/threonine-protein kinase, partial [Streptomyces sp. S6]